jgi:exonuclease III
MDINVLSYNFWFEPVLERERINALASVVQNERIDILCLQEIKPQILKILKSVLKFNHCFPKNIRTSYGCVIFSKYPISKCLEYPFNNSSMGRSLVMATVKIPYNNLFKEVLIATTHFESVFNKTSINREKVDQFCTTESLLRQLHKNMEHIILCVDTNLLQHEEDYFIDTCSGTLWKDLWKETGNNSCKFTFDGKQNTYLKMKNCPYRSRLDRILYTYRTVNPINYKLISKQDGVEISDHFGVFGKFEIKYKE